MEIIQPEHINRAVTIVRQGGLIAFPTETVYGLGAPVSNEDLIKKIFLIKGRPANNPLIVHISDLNQVQSLAFNIPPTFYRLADQFFPGPLTIVLQKRPEISSLISAGQQTIAVRMPKHPIALELIKGLDEPIVAPSANLSGKPSSTCVWHVIQDFEGKIPAVIDGGSCEYGIESTVVDLTTPSPCILRPGCISEDLLEDALGIAFKKATKMEKKASPGTAYRHYAPEANISVFENLHILETYLDQKERKKRFFMSTENLSGFYLVNPSNLYALFRQANEENAEEIILVSCLSRLEPALKDRLEKAIFYSQKPTPFNHNVQA